MVEESEGRRLSLNGSWELNYGPQVGPARGLTQPIIPSSFAVIDARVPGNVELDLVRAGVLPADLDHGDNAYRVLAFEEHQWWYRRRFEIDDPARFPNAVLRLEGVDTVATIWLNGIRVGATDNMLVPHELPLGPALRQGRNELLIAIDSAVLAAREHPVDAGSWAMENNWESLFIRKAPHVYGWDIMPRVVSAGLWRDVAIEARPACRFADVYVATLATDPARRSATVLMRWAVPATNRSAGRKVVLEVKDPRDGRTVHVAEEAALGASANFARRSQG